MGNYDYRTEYALHIWPTTDLDIASVAPAATFRSQQVDMEGSVFLTPAREEFSTTLWNIGDPRDVHRLFQTRFIAGLDLTRIPLQNGGRPVMERVVLGRIKTSMPVTDSETGEIGFRIQAIPLSETLRELHIRQTYEAQAQPHKLKTVVQDLLRRSGLGVYHVEIPDNLTLPSFVADGTVWSEIRRAAGKASSNVAVWMRGNSVVVGTEFLAGLEIDEALVTDAQVEEDGSIQPMVPTLPLEFEETGEAFDYSEMYAASSEESQIATGQAAPSSGFRIELPLAPEVMRGTTHILRGAAVLARLGIYGSDRQAINVLGIEHQFSNLPNAGPDFSFLHATAKPTEVEA